MDFSFRLYDLKIFVPVVIGLLSFLIFWFTQQSVRLKSRFEEKFGSETGGAKFILFSRYLGGFSMGVIPAAIFLSVLPDADFGAIGFSLTRESLKPVVFLSLTMVLILFPLVYANTKKPNNLLVYPQIRNGIWNQKLVWKNLFSWAVYLFGYEVLFRGVLLFPLVEAIGVWPAISINIALYSATHIPKGFTETIGAIPFSVVLCLICLYTGNFWVAFIAHLTMAWTNTIFSLRHHPEMRVIRNISR